MPDGAVKSSARKLIPAVIGGVVFLLCLRYILFSFQWENILQVLQSANLFWLVGGSLFLLVPFSLLRALRWYILLQRLGVVVKFGPLYLCTVASFSASLVTPFQSGEMLKVELLKGHGVLGRSAGYSTFVVERAMDLLVVFSLAAISILNGFLGPAVQVSFWQLGVLFFLTGGGLLLLRQVRLGGKAGKFLDDLRRATQEGRWLLALLAITLAIWLDVVVSWQVCLYSIGIEPGIQKTVALMSVTTLLGILSFVPGALGVSEVGITGLLIYLGQSDFMAQAGAVVLRIYGIWVIFFGVLHYLLWNRVVARQRGSLASLGKSP